MHGCRKLKEGVKAGILHPHPHPTRTSKRNKKIRNTNSKENEIRRILILGIAGVSTLSFVQCSEEHNVSVTDLFPSADEGMGDTYSVGPARSS
jgi:hypothetical protein